MAVGKPYSIGSSWPGDVLRRLLGVRGKWEPPGSLQDQLAAVVEVRPQFDWEYFRAGWVRGFIHANAAAVAGQFSHVAIGNPTNSGRVCVILPPALTNGTIFHGLYTGGTFGGAPGTSSGFLDGRWVNGNASLLGQLATLIATGSAAALPAAGLRMWFNDAARNTSAQAPRVLLLPGQALFWWGGTVNQSFDYSSEVLEIPLEDMS